MLLESLSYDNLIIGGSDLVTEQITIGKSQTILRGDLIIKDEITGVYIIPTAAVISSDDVLVASEPITTDTNTTTISIGYRAGEFNEFSMRFGGTSTSNDNREVLASKSIYMKQVQ